MVYLNLLWLGNISLWFTQQLTESVTCRFPALNPHLVFDRRKPFSFVSKHHVSFSLKCFIVYSIIYQWEFGCVECTSQVLKWRIWQHVLLWIRNGQLCQAIINISDSATGEHIDNPDCADTFSFNRFNILSVELWSFYFKEFLEFLFISRHQLCASRKTSLTLWSYLV